MSELLTGVRGWWIGSAIGGGVVLLVAAWLMARTKAPALRQRLGEWGVVAAVLVAALRLCPSWLNVPDPQPAIACHPVPKAPMAAPEPSPPVYQPIELAELARAQTGPQLDTIRDVPTLHPQLEPAASAPASSPAPATVPAPPMTAEPRWQQAISWLDWAAGCYGIVVALLLTRWLLGQWALGRMIRRSAAAPESVQEIFDRIARVVGRPDARLAVSDRVGVPLCCGLRTPTVVVPRSLVLSNDVAVFRWVFAHELTHLARRDTWSVWCMGIARAVFFYLPWFWWLRRQVRLCQEYIADAAAAAQGPWAEDYAQFLVSLARGPAVPAGATGVFESTSDLYRRVSMVLKPYRGAASRRQLASGVACLLASAVLLAGLGVRAESPGDEKKKDDDAAIKKDVEIKVIVLDDDAKKDGDKKDGERKDMIKKRIMINDVAPLVAAAAFDKAEVEKKLRKALSATDLSAEQVDKVMKEAMTAMEQAMKAHHLGAQAAVWATPPAMAQFQPHIAQLAGPMTGGTFVMGHVGGGRLGVMVEKPNAALAEQLDLDKNQGLVILEVVKGSAAEKAGLKANDIMLRFADHEVSADSGKFIKIIADVPSDKQVSAVVLRKGRKETISGIKLAEKQQPLTMKIDGATVEGGKNWRIETGPLSNKSEKSSNKSVKVTINDGDFSAQETDNDLTISVTGTVDGKKVKVKSVTIEEPGSKATYSSLAKVPAKYRSKVEKLISNSGDSSIKFDSHKEKN